MRVSLALQDHGLGSSTLEFRCAEDCARDDFIEAHVVGTFIIIIVYFLPPADSMQHFVWPE